GDTGPGIVVIQEIFGVNHVMRDIADDLAAQGFVALCPDLFWRLEPGIQLTDKSPEEWDRAFELFGAFDVDAGVKDIQSTIDALRSYDACTGKVGAVGYCLGGLLSYLTAARTNADAAVGFYGVNIQEKLDEASNISNPLMLHIAKEDGFVPAEAQVAIRAGLEKNEKVRLHEYAGMEHAFARVGGEHYDAENAKLANSRTMDFFNTHLT
ncbi:MAG: dienelactone hydrolase family protein, partial [Alphaproteobacteria bacterium]